MTHRTAFRLTLFFLFVLPLAGCASMHPRLTIYADRSAAETHGSMQLHTTTDKYGASVSIDLP